MNCFVGETKAPYSLLTGYLPYCIFARYSADCDVEGGKFFDLLC